MQLYGHPHILILKKTLFNVILIHTCFREERTLIPLAVILKFQIHALRKIFIKPALDCEGNQLHA